MNEQIAQLAMDGLYTDGAHHKQFFLDQILRLASGEGYFKITRLLEETDGVPLDTGIAP